MAEIYDVGDRPRLTTTFTDVNGVLTDPVSVVCRVKTPNLVTWVYAYGSSAELTRTSVGVYNLDLRLTEPKTWAYKWDSGSSSVLLDASAQGTLEVRRSLA